MLNYSLAFIRTFIRDEDGASAVEYGLIVGLIAVAVAAVLFTIGGDLNNLFQDVADCIGAPASCGEAAAG